MRGNDDELRKFETYPVSRAKAAARGLPRYFTGKSCKSGHVSDRLTASSHCRACLRAQGTSPAGHEKKHRYEASPLGHEAKHRATIPGLKAAKRCGDMMRARWVLKRNSDTRRAQPAAKRKGCMMRRASRQSLMSIAIMRRRELRLEHALDSSRDTFDPGRAARLLAQWSARL